MSEVNEPAESLSQKLKRAAKTNAKESIKETSDASNSPYFSPRKTRNKIRIKYENSGEVPSIKPLLKEVLNDEKEEKPSKKSAKRPSSKVAKVTSDKSEKEAKWQPENWKKIIENLKVMRKNVPAPVDTMGCDQCSDENADEKTKRFHKLVALMLSAQTKDQVTYDAIARLKARELTPENVVSWKTSEFEDLLKPVSFYKNKAKYIQKASQILIDEYDSDIPNTLDGLMKLPGVGPKMAHICMKSAWNIVSGIGVDVHVHRISNRLKWLRKQTKQPEETRVELESWLPSEHWSEINILLVGFGQTICTPINPKCNICLNNQICPSAFASEKKSPKK